jgi:hypothetical protein
LGRAGERDVDIDEWQADEGIGEAERKSGARADATQMSPEGRAQRSTEHPPGEADGTLLPLSDGACSPNEEQRRQGQGVRVRVGKAGGALEHCDRTAEWNERAQFVPDACLDRDAAHRLPGKQRARDSLDRERHHSGDDEDRGGYADDSRRTTHPRPRLARGGQPCPHPDDGSIGHTPPSNRSHGERHDRYRENVERNVREGQDVDRGHDQQQARRIAVAERDAEGPGPALMLNRKEPGQACQQRHQARNDHTERYHHVTRASTVPGLR